jgi:hypothetical protein
MPAHRVPVEIQTKVRHDKYLKQCVCDTLPKLIRGVQCQMQVDLRRMPAVLGQSEVGFWNPPLYAIGVVVVEVVASQRLVGDLTR